MLNALDLVFYFLVLPLPWMLAAALLGWLPRRRLADAALFAGAALLADQAEHGVGAQVLLCAVAPLYAATRRPRLSVLTGLALLALLLTGTVLKKRYAGSPLTWQDLQFFFLQLRANVGVFASQPGLLLRAVPVVVLLAGAIAAGFWLDRRLAAAPMRPAHVAVLWVCALLLAGAGARDVLAQAGELNRHGVLVVGNVPLNDDLAYPLTRFVATASLRPAWQPALSDTHAFQQQVAQHAGTGGDGPPADIVMFLQESQFNPISIGGCPESLCRLDAFGARAQTRAHGPLRVHVFGGGTWLSEFAAATGVPHDAFGAAGAFAPFNVAAGVKHSFVRSLKDAGYRTVAVYPGRGAMMNARAAYAGYGFDRFYDAVDLGLPDSFTTPDAVMHAAAQRVLAEERKRGQPVFLFALTIFNHGEHGIHMDRVPPDLVVRARAFFADRAQAGNVADYVWRTREFGQALADSRREVLGAGRPAVLAWFGDHQPAFASAPGVRDAIRPLAGDRIPARFQTWYHIESNVDHLPALAQEQAADLVFLPGLLAQAAGVRLDDWLAANVTAREHCGGLLYACRDPQAANAYLSWLWRDLKAFELP